MCHMDFKAPYMDIAITREETPPADILTEIWERSVRATHTFITEDEIAMFRPQVREMLLAIRPFVLRVDGVPSGFLALNEQYVEALFIDPPLFCKGLGGRLLRAAIEAGATTVDVNEENPGALAFYLASGFRQTGRSPLDPSGLPHPIIHLALGR